MSANPTNFFPSLGEIATRTDARAEVADNDSRFDESGTARENEEDEDMQEIGSLCMRCHEQVRSNVIGWRTKLTPRV